MPVIKALVASGSGTLFPSHLGFYQAIYDQANSAFIDPQQIECVAGTSGGGFTSLLFLVCLVLPNPPEAFKACCDDLLRYGIDDLMTKLDFSLLLTNYGLLSIELFECHFVDVLRIHAKCDGQDGRPSPFMTFQEFHEYTGRTFVVVASNPTTNTPKYFSHKETPEVKIMAAIRFSMTVTGLFGMEKNDINDEWHRSKYSPGDWKYVDGCFSDNYPLQYVADLLGLPSKTAPEILGNFIGDHLPPPAETEGPDVISFLISQAAWVISSRIQPDPVNSIMVPALPHESVLARLSLHERNDLLERSKAFTSDWLRVNHYHDK